MMSRLTDADISKCRVCCSLACGNKSHHDRQSWSRLLKFDESSMARRQASDAFLRIGLPMFILVTGGSFLLSQLLQGKYDIKEAQDKASDLGLQTQTGKSHASLEDELQKLQAQIDLDAYTNKPVPKPDEE
ncbi:g7479 [Coccomyxa viridis]|uniref:G7479 protein n=1 Tax=Coccomyxa viridis TaxID=1274662 RepID=A0ABP1FXY7_9CHLO